MAQTETRNQRPGRESNEYCFPVPCNCFDVVVSWEEASRRWIATDNGLAAATWLTAYDQWPVTMTDIIDVFCVTCHQDAFCAFDDCCQLRAAYRLITALLCIEEVRLFAYGKPPQFNKGEKMSDILKQQRDECASQLEILHRLCHENCNFLEKMTKVHSEATRSLLADLTAHTDPAVQVTPVAWLTSGSNAMVSYWQEGLNCSLEYQRQLLKAMAKK